MDAEQRQGSAWLPPLEARELGSGLESRHYRLSKLSRALIACGAAVLALVVIGRVISVAAGSATESPREVARAFVDARATGDGAAACDLLTPRARRDLVALVRAVDAPQGDAAECPRYVLMSSERSEFTDPALPRFRDHELRELRWPGAEGRRFAEVRADGVPRVTLELRLIDGDWKLDGLAAERVSFMAGCTDKGAARRYCGCLFDRLADEGHASNEEFAALRREMREAGGSAPPGFQQAVAACAALR